MTLIGSWLISGPALAIAVPPKTIPLGEIHGVQIILAWLTESEERTWVLAMFLLFISREIYGFIKIKFGKVGNQLKGLESVPEKLEQITKNHEELSDEIRSLTKAMTSFEREVHKQIREEVKYTLEMMKNRRQ